MFGDFFVFGVDLVDYNDLQLLNAHYEHFSHYYQSDMLDHTSLGLPSNDEKTYSTLVVYRLIDTLAKNVSHIRTIIFK